MDSFGNTDQQVKKFIDRDCQKDDPVAMHLVVLRFLAGFFGALSSIFLLGSLGSDYWLLVSESCEQGDVAVFRPWRVTKVRVGHIYCLKVQTSEHVLSLILRIHLTYLHV